MTIEAPPDGGTNTDDMLPRSEAEKAFAARDKAKEAAKAKDATIAELQEALNAYRSKEQEAEEAMQRKAGEFDKLLAKRENEWAKKQQEKEARIAELEKAEQARAKQDRFGKFKSAILGKAKADPVVLEGLMLKAELEGMDIAPEAFGDDEVADAIKQLRGMSEAAFQTSRMGVPPSSADRPGGRTKAQEVVDMVNRQSKGAAWRARFTQ